MIRTSITNAVLDDIKEWQQRPLEKVYFIVWMDGIVFKIRHNGKVINKTIYLFIGINRHGYTEVLGVWIKQAIQAIFPFAITPLCIVHQIRNSSR